MRLWQISILEIRILTMNQVICFIANSSALTHIYPVHAHRGSETESEGSDLAPVSDVEMDVDENNQDFTSHHNPLKLGVK